MKKHPIQQKQIQILCTNFWLGSKAIDIIGLNEYGELLLIFLSDKKKYSKNLLSKNIRSYILSLFDLFTISQREFTIKAILINEKEMLTLDKIKFKPKFVIKKKYEVIGEKKGIKHSLIVNNLDYKELVDLVFENLNQIYSSIFFDSLEQYDVKIGEKITIDKKNYYPHIQLITKKGFEKIILIEGDLTNDPVLKAIRINSLKEQINAYTSIINTHSIIIITQFENEDIKKLSDEKKITYVSLDKISN